MRDVFVRPIQMRSSGTTNMLYKMYKNIKEFTDRFNKIVQNVQKHFDKSAICGTI